MAKKKIHIHSEEERIAPHIPEEWRDQLKKGGAHRNDKGYHRNDKHRNRDKQQREDSESSLFLCLLPISGRSR
jgi:hypothetical protein